MAWLDLLIELSMIITSSVRLEPLHYINTFFWLSNFSLPRILSRFGCVRVFVFPTRSFDCPFLIVEFSRTQQIKCGNFMMMFSEADTMHIEPHHAIRLYTFHLPLLFVWTCYECSYCCCSMYRAQAFTLCMNTFLSLFNLFSDSAFNFFSCCCCCCCCVWTDKSHI